MIPTHSERRIRQGFACSRRRSGPVGAAAFTAIAIFAISGLAACDSGSSDGPDGVAEYVASVRDFREKRDSDFGRAGSPIPEDARSGFSGLRYYPPDPAYRVTARYYGGSAEDTIMLATSTGEEREMRRVGRLRFPRPGVEDSVTDSLELDVFRPVGENEREWFLPFEDETNGKTTYGAGRYLEIDGPEGEDGTSGENLVTLDFNYAYNPFCAYNQAYSCPLVPRENRLQVSIRAGERYEVGDE